MKTKIEWTDHSWNPIRARNLKTGKLGHYCEHATTGCEFCYAERMNKRLGTGLPFKPGHRKDVELFLDEKVLLAPLRWRKRRMIFVCSMTDLFANFVPDEWIDRVFAVMALCPQHTFQVLTKRAERMRSYCTSLSESEDHLERICDAAVHITKSPCAAHIEDVTLPLPNVWNGVSAERQQEADERIPHLLETPASVRFVSAEPLIDRIDFSQWLTENPSRKVGGIFWMIIGGESGPGARTMHVEWVDSIVEQCKAAGVACFVKQLGSAPSSSGYPLHLRSSKGGDQNEWPKRLRVREFPR